MKEAYLYGADAASRPGTEGLNAFFLLVDKPEVYNLRPIRLRSSSASNRFGCRSRWRRWG
jgi:hypothetical protein